MAQKMMLKKTKAAGKYAVCATEMLASMEAGWVQWLCGLVGRKQRNAARLLQPCSQH